MSLGNFVRRIDVVGHGEDNIGKLCIGFFRYFCLHLSVSQCHRSMCLSLYITFFPEKKQEKGRSTDENYIRRQHIQEKFINCKNANHIFQKTTLFHLIFLIHPHIGTGTDKTFVYSFVGKTSTSFERKKSNYMLVGSFICQQKQFFLCKNFLFSRQSKIYPTQID